MPARLDLTRIGTDLADTTNSVVAAIYRGDAYALQFSNFLDAAGAAIAVPATPVPRMKAVSEDRSTTIDFSAYLSYTAGAFPLNLIVPLGVTSALVPGRYTYDLELWAGFTGVYGDMMIVSDVTV